MSGKVLKPNLSSVESCKKYMERIRKITVGHPRLNSLYHVYRIINKNSPIVDVKAKVIGHRSYVGSTYETKYRPYKDVPHGIAHRVVEGHLQGSMLKLDGSYKTSGKMNNAIREACAIHGRHINEFMNNYYAGKSKLADIGLKVVIEHTEPAGKESMLKALLRETYYIEKYLCKHDGYNWHGVGVPGQSRDCHNLKTPAQKKQWKAKMKKVNALTSRQRVQRQKQNPQLLRLQVQRAIASKKANGTLNLTGNRNGWSKKVEIVTRAGENLIFDSCRAAEKHFGICRNSLHKIQNHLKGENPLDHYLGPRKRNTPFGKARLTIKQIKFGGNNCENR